MLKRFAFTLLLALPCMLWAAAPTVMTTESPAGGATQTAWDAVLPLYHLSQDSRFAERGLDAFDSTVWLDDFEGSQPMWTTRDLTDIGLFWHLDDTLALGGTGLAWYCADTTLAPGLGGAYNDHWLQFLVLDTFSLAGTTAPRVTMQARWKIENPGGEPAPYDMWDGWNVWASSDLGATWSVLNAISPAYTGQNSYAFGVIWNYGPGIPAHGGTAYANAYVQCSFDLSPFAGQNTMLVRIAFCSDDGFSGVDDPTYYGLVVDSIRVSDGATVILANDGEADDCVVQQGPVAGNNWVYTTEYYHSPTHGWTCNPGLNLLCGVISPPVTLPVTSGIDELSLRYWVWCDQPGWRGEGNSLADYYDIWITTDNGVTYTRLVYDYAYNDGDPPPGGNSLLGWVLRKKGLTSGGISQPSIRLTPYNGQTVRFMFRARYDGQDTSGVGTGVHIDDVHVVLTRAYPRDLAAKDIRVPFPTVRGLARSWSYTLKNEGTEGASIRARVRFTRPGGTIQGIDSNIVLAGQLAAGRDTVITRVWTPDSVGCYLIRVVANLTGDQDRSNDTTYSPINVPLNPDSNFAVNVRPPGEYELAYHLRSMNVSLLNPRYVRYTPLQDGVPPNVANAYDIVKVQILFAYDATIPDSGARTWIEFWDQGPDSTRPGALLYRFETRIDTSETIGAAGYPKWWTLNLCGIPALRNRSGDFWVSVTPKDSIGGRPMPLIVGRVTSPPTYDWHNFTMRLDTVGAPINPSPSRFCIETTIIPTTGASVPAPVTNLTIIRDGYTGNVLLNWSPTTGARVYFVWRTTSASQHYSQGTLLTPNPLTETRYVDGTAIPTAGTRYFYTVIACN